MTTSSNYRWHHTDGKWYRFDDIGCRNKFIGNPDKYLEPRGRRRSTSAPLNRSVRRGAALSRAAPPRYRTAAPDATPDRRPRVTTATVPDRHRLRGRDRPRGPRAAQHPLEDVLRLRERLLRRAAEHAGLRGLSRDAGRAAGDQPQRRGPHDPHRPRARLHDPPALQVRPQELPLPRPDEGLPDLAVRRAALPRRRGTDRAGRRAARDRPRAHSPRGGHGPPAASRGGTGRRGRLLAARRQPFRGAADGDRLRAGHAIARGGRRLPARVAPHAALPRCLRRRHGEGLVPLRRQYLAAPPRRSARLEGRDQEHELVPRRPACDRVRDPAAGRRPRRRRQRRAGDARLHRGDRRDGQPALEGGGARLPLLPRAGPAAARDRRDTPRGDSRAPAGATRRQARALRGASTASLPPRRACWPRRARAPTPSRPPSPPRSPAARRRSRAG